MNNFLKIIGGFSLVIIALLLNGYVMSVLWEWFIADTFDTVLINIPQGIGIALVVKLLTVDSRFKQTEEHLTVIMSGFFSPLALLGIGYICKMFL